jgi:hypothetical protein
VKERTRIFIEAFLDGFTGAGVFRDLKLPGAPTRLFADESEIVVAEPADVPNSNQQKEQDRKKSADSKPQGK